MFIKEMVCDMMGQEGKGWAAMVRVVGKRDTLAGYGLCCDVIL